MQRAESAIAQLQAELRKKIRRTLRCRHVALGACVLVLLLLYLNVQERQLHRPKLASLIVAAVLNCARRARHQLARRVHWFGRVSSFRACVCTRAAPLGCTRCDVLLVHEVGRGLVSHAHGRRFRHRTSAGRSGEGKERGHLKQKRMVVVASLSIRR